MISWELCNKGIIWIPNNHSNINIWESNWIPKFKNLRQAIQGPTTIQDESLTIKDIRTNNTWDLKKLAFELPKPLINSILSITPTESPKDIPTWALIENGKFTSNSCYKVVSNINKNLPDFSWIWNLKCLNKIKYFLWKCLHNKLPTRSYLNYIGINIDPICPTCKSENETNDHIFIRCKMVRDIWIFKCLNNDPISTKTIGLLV